VASSIRSWIIHCKAKALGLVFSFLGIRVSWTRSRYDIISLN
jgi:hypothetical protein